jgi:hypothetical protein
MKSRQKRLKAIELSLILQQVEVVWLRNALQAGTLKDGARHSPPYRGTVANAQGQNDGERHECRRRSTKGGVFPAQVMSL